MKRLPRRTFAEATRPGLALRAACSEAAWHAIGSTEESDVGYALVLEDELFTALEKRALNVVLPERERVAA